MSKILPNNTKTVTLVSVVPVPKKKEDVAFLKARGCKHSKLRNFLTIPKNWIGTRIYECFPSGGAMGESRCDTYELSNGKNKPICKLITYEHGDGFYQKLEINKE